MNAVGNVNNKPVALVWDMGGITCSFFTELIVELARKRNWPLNELPVGPTGPCPDPDYDAMDRGEISEPEYVQRLIENLAAMGIDFLPDRDLSFAEADRAETWALVERCGAMGYRQGLLTNDATRWLGQDWRDAWVHQHHFESIVDIADIGIRKPAPEPYLAILAQLKLEPSECLFIDDMRANCAGAEAVGMQSYWFDVRDPVTSVSQLGARLGV